MWVETIAHLLAPFLDQLRISGMWQNCRIELDNGADGFDVLKLVEFYLSRAYRLQRSKEILCVNCTNHSVNKNKVSSVNYSSYSHHLALDHPGAF